MKNNFNTDYHSSRERFRSEVFENKNHNKLPLRYVFILTNKCNLDCSFCFQDRKRREGSLDYNDWLNLTNQLPDYAHITLTGGEPLVFKNFDLIFKEIDKKYSSNIISNGLLLNEKFIDLFVNSKKLKVFSISIDDIGNLNRDVKESQWKKLEANINLFKDKINENFKNSQDLESNKLLIDSKTVVLDQNANSLFEIYKYLKLKLRIDTHSFQFLKGSPIQHADFSFEYNKIFENSLAYEYKNFDSILEQLEKVREFNIENNYSSFTHPKYIDLNSTISVYDQSYKYFNITKHDQNNYKLCQAPWESMHINVDGAVYPCLAVELGNIKKNTLNEIFFGQKYELFKKDLIKNKTFQACNRCGYLRIHI